MSVVDDLRGLSAAEEFFKYLDVEYEQQVVNVARLHILRRMADYLRKESAEATSSAEASSESETRARYRAHLQAAYADFVARTPIEERVFKVHKDAVKEKSGPKKVFVPLSALK